MSCENYRRRKALEVGFKSREGKDETKRFMDDRELLALLLTQERSSDQTRTVSFESMTSD